MTSSAIDDLNAYVRANAPKSAAPADMRAWFDNLVRVTPVPEEAKLVESTSPVPSYWIRPKNANPDRVILYVHGGGYILGSPRTHQELAYRFAKESTAQCLTVDYRLVPENPYPDCVDDVFDSYRYLLREGFAPQCICIAGDSAGGGMTLSAAMRIRDQRLPQPGCLVCFSPWTDFTGSGESLGINGSFDPMVDPKMIHYLAQTVVGNQDRAAASPLFAHLSNLPPLLVHAGTKEVLLDDSVRFVKRYAEAGNDVVFETWDGMNHVFQLFPTFLREAITAVEHAGAFVREKLVAVEE